MPIREFRCPNQHLTERIILIESEEDLELVSIPCPSCDRRATKVEWSVPGRRNPAHGLQT